MFCCFTIPQDSKFINLSHLGLLCLPGVHFFRLNAILKYPWLFYQMGTVSWFPIRKHTFRSRVETSTIYFLQLSHIVPSHAVVFWWTFSLCWFSHKNSAQTTKEEEKEMSETDNGLNMNEEILPGEDKAVCVARVSPCELKKDDQYVLLL